MLFFDKAPPSEAAATKALWIYDLRTNQRFTLKERPMTRADLDDFVARFRSGAAYKREESERFRKFPLEALLARDKLNLDILWSTTPPCCPRLRWPHPGVSSSPATYQRLSRPPARAEPAISGNGTHNDVSSSWL